MQDVQPQISPALGSRGAHGNRALCLICSVMDSILLIYFMFNMFSILLMRFMRTVYFKQFYLIVLHFFMLEFLGLFPSMDNLPDIYLYIYFIYTVCI